MLVAAVAAFLRPAASAAPEEQWYQHGPYSNGRCEYCHTPHNAAAPAGLTQSEKQLCFFCHLQAKEDFTIGVRHEPVRSQPCSVCHDPHQSRWPKMLKKAQADLCLDCHPKIREELQRASTHRPAKEGRCTDCHEPHNSPYPHLLKKPFEQAFYSSFATRKYGLCFGCHPQALATEPQGTYTGFRDGKKSTHYFHVNDPVKGRSCWVCHEPHGSSQPRLVKTKVSFGKWSLPIVFTKTSSGGGCLCGCHKLLGYQR
jgi:predicted CXXCH cytochrome family protein